MTSDDTQTSYRVHGAGPCNGTLVTTDRSLVRRLSNDGHRVTAVTESA